MGNKKELFISALGAISIYIVFLLIFFVYTQKKDIAKIKNSTKVTILQLDVVLNDPVQKEKPHKSMVKKSQKATNKIVKRSTSSSVKQRSNLKSLFANVKISSKTIKKQKALNIKNSSISSRFKSKFEKEKKSQGVEVSKLIKKTAKKEQIKNISVDKQKNNNDPYYQKINQIISNRWIPTVFQNILKAKVIVSIDNNGKFSYKFIQYSDNSMYDEQLRKFLDNESKKIYPVSPSGKKVNIEVIFQSKG